VIDNGPRNFSYKDPTGHELFRAVTDPTSALVWWTDSKLVYQQYTNTAFHTYQNGTFAAFFLQQASFDNGDSFAIDDFFRQTDRLNSFHLAHPGADLQRATRDKQWLVFRDTWYSAIIAGSCRTIDLCP